MLIILVLKAEKVFAKQRFPLFGNIYLNVLLDFILIKRCVRVKLGLIMKDTRNHLYKKLTGIFMLKFFLLFIIKTIQNGILHLL